MKLVNIGPMDIYEGNHKLTLALIFQIILVAQIDSIEVDGLKGQHGLLLWVNRQIEPFGQHVSDFAESWRDGKAFAALAAALCQDYNWESHQGLDQDARHATSYEAMDEELKVPKLLDPEDFRNPEIDDKSVLTYVSTIFNAVASDDESRRHVQAIDKVAQLAMKHGSIILKYEREAKNYVKLLDEKIEYFKNTEPNEYEYVLVLSIVLRIAVVLLTSSISIRRLRRTTSRVRRLIWRVFSLIFMRVNAVKIVLCIFLPKVWVLMRSLRSTVM